jgi:predicted negative regulator of RcsB-dependent stress response
MTPEAVKGYWKVQLACLAILVVLIAAVYINYDTSNISRAADTTPDSITIFTTIESELITQFLAELNAKYPDIIANIVQDSTNIAFCR